MADVRRYDRTEAETYFPQVAERIFAEFPRRMKWGSGFWQRFGVDHSFGLDLPFAKQLLHAAVVVDGKLQEFGLLGRDDAVNELPPSCVPIPSTARGEHRGLGHIGNQTCHKQPMLRCDSTLLGFVSY